MALKGRLESPMPRDRRRKAERQGTEPRLCNLVGSHILSTSFSISFLFSFSFQVLTLLFVVEIHSFCSRDESTRGGILAVALGHWLVLAFSGFGID